MAEFKGELTEVKKELAHSRREQAEQRQILDRLVTLLTQTQQLEPSERTRTAVSDEYKDLEEKNDQSDEHGLDEQNLYVEHFPFEVSEVSNAEAQVESSHSQLQVEATNLPNNCITWPEKWTSSKGKTIFDAFYDYYVKDLPNTYNSLQSKKKVKGTWCEINRVVYFMRCFLNEPIPSPPGKDAPRVQRSEWESKIASLARQAGGELLAYLKSLNLRKNNNDSLSGNAKLLLKAPKPLGKSPVMDFYENDSDQIQITTFFAARSNTAQSSAADVLEPDDELSNQVASNDDLIRSNMDQSPVVDASEHEDELAPPIASMDDLIDAGIMNGLSE
jgi:hypothetical protein